MIVTEIQITMQENYFQIHNQKVNFEQAINGMCKERLIRTKDYLD